MRKMLSALTAMLLVLAALPVMAQETQPDTARESQWIHLRVDEQDGTKVNVNLPIALIEVALDIAQEHAFQGEHGPLHFGKEHDISVADLRTMWGQVRDAGDAEYVNVTDDEQNVRVYRQGDRVHIDVDKDGRQQVRMQIPFSVIDVLLQGDGEQLDLLGALRELARSNDGEVIRVDDEDTNVRIWIDTQPQG